MMRRIIRKGIYFIPALFLFLGACQEQQPKLSTLMPGAVILAFGDSLTYGTGASLNASYPQNLQTMTGLKVVNAGVPGEETQQGLERIGSVLEQTHPNLVILCLGANDLMRKRPLDQIKENLRKIILLIQKSGAQVVLIGVPTVSWDLTVPNFYAELGRELNIPVDTKIVAKLERVPEYKADYIHFNNRGYRAFAEALLHFLRDRGAFA